MGEGRELRHLEHILHDLSLRYKEHRHGFLLKGRSLMMELLAVLTEHFSTSVIDIFPENYISQMERLGNALDYVEENCRESIGLTDAAEYMGFSREYFCRYFKKNTGYTFMEYLYNIRLNHVYQDLLMTDDPVGEIIERNGVTNLKLFYERFRRKYGCTPGEVRRQASFETEK